MRPRNTVGRQFASTGTRLFISFVGIILLIGFVASPVLAASPTLASQNSMASGSLWSKGQLLVTTNKQYRLDLLNNGSLVIENANFNILWSDEVNSSSGAGQIELQENGYLVAKSSSGRLAWSTKTLSRTTSTLELLNDGDLVLRNTSKLLWTSKTAAPTRLPEGLSNIDSALQVIIVTSDVGSSSYAWLTSYQWTAEGWTSEFPAMAARVGAHGWLSGSQRREGDLTTPLGDFSIGTSMYGNQPDPGVLYPYHRLVPGDYWDENSQGGRLYNSFRHSVITNCAHNPFGANTECLWEEKAAYPYFAVINFNTPSAGDFGSGIFLHATEASTEGCVTIHVPDLLKLLRWLNPSDNPRIVLAGASPLHNF